MLPNGALIWMHPSHCVMFVFFLTHSLWLVYTHLHTSILVILNHLLMAHALTLTHAEHEVWLPPCTQQVHTTFNLAKVTPPHLTHIQISHTCDANRRLKCIQNEMKYFPSALSALMGAFSSVFLFCFRVFSALNASQANSGLFCSCSRDYPGLLLITLARSAPLCVRFGVETEWVGGYLINHAVHISIVSYWSYFALIQIFPACKTRL